MQNAVTQQWDMMLLLLLWQIRVTFLGCTRL